MNQYDQNSLIQISNDNIINSEIKSIQNSKSNIRVEKVHTKEDLKKFYHIPWVIYKDDPNWVAPFWIEYKSFFNQKNLFWSHAESQLFIIYKNNKIVGRIAAIIDHLYCETYKEKIGFFGFFECINDIQCAHTLFSYAQDWFESKGIEKIQGPISGRIDVGCGLLHEGNNIPPTLLSSYNPTYYLSFFTTFNMVKSRDLFEYYIDLTKPIPNKLIEKANQCKKDGITIRTFNRLQSRKELDWWIDLFLETFEKHWGYVPVSPGEVETRFGVKQIRWFIDSSLFHIAELNGKPIAYLWSTPEYNQVFQKMNGKLNPYQLIKFLKNKNKINLGKLHLIGIKKGLRNKNIGSYLNHAALVEMKKRGYAGAIVGWIDEENKHARSTIAITGAEIIKKFRVFEKNINRIGK